MVEAVSFRETQRFRQPWLWVFLAVSALVSLVRRRWRKVAMLAVVAGLFSTSRLTTEVREDGVYIQFEPFHRSFRRIAFEDIEHSGPLKFDFLTYGGIGLRWTPDAIAYTTRRGEGVEIDRTDGKTVVIGSQQPDQLAAAIAEQ
jgi:hypothetical protein